MAKELSHITETGAARMVKDSALSPFFRRDIPPKAAVMTRLDML
jgi:hypothetical protein